MNQLDIKRSSIILDPDRTHVLARPFRVTTDKRSAKIRARVMALPENEVHRLLMGVRAEFGAHQLKIDDFLRRRFDAVSPGLPDGESLSEERKLLLGGFLPTSIRSRPLRCLIPLWRLIRISRIPRPAHCVSF
jgi:hypothetical protein